MYVKLYDYKGKTLKRQHWKIEIYTNFSGIYLLLEIWAYFVNIRPESFLFHQGGKKKIRDRSWVSDDGVSDRVWVCIVLCDMKLGLLFTFNRAGDKDPVVFDEPILKEIAERKKKSIAQVRFVVRVIFLSSQRWSMHNIIRSNSDIKYTNNITIINWLNVIIWYHTCKLFSHFNMTVNRYIFCA